MGTSGIVAGAGLSKDQVRYRQHEKCLTCIHFYPANSCEVVSGNISQEAVCDRWEIKKSSEAKDGELYKEQFEKKQYIKNPGYESGAKFYIGEANKAAEK